VIDLIDAAVHPDGYLHTFYDAGPGSQPRYRDLSTKPRVVLRRSLHRSGLAHHAVTGETVPWTRPSAGPTTYVPPSDPAASSRPTGTPRPSWRWPASADAPATTATSIRPSGSSRPAGALGSVDRPVRAGRPRRAGALSGVGHRRDRRATRDPRWLEATARLFDSLVGEHSYPTGAIGSRWLDESVGKPFELPDAMSYTESCAAVASLRFCQQVWDLTQDPRALDQIELLAYNAVPCGVGSHGESWFYFAAPRGGRGRR